MADEAPAEAGDAAAGLAGEFPLEPWLEVEARLRRHAAALFGCAPEDVALVKNTSEALSLLAFGLDWRPGDVVVHGADDFPSNRIVWEAAAERFGLGRRTVAVARGPDPEGALVAAMDAGPTRLLAVSSVHYATGLRLDLARLGAACAERGVIFCVDAIQSLGALPMDVRAWGIHWAAADGHKWLLGPEGCGLLYADPALRDRVRLQQYGWHVTERPSDFEASEWRLRADAARFEPGSPNMLGIHALAASLGLLREAGAGRIEREILKKVLYLSNNIENIKGIRVVGAEAGPERRAGILALDAGGPRRARALHAHLRRAGVVCALRAGLVRLSPHWYTPRAALDQALLALRAWASGT